MLFTDLETDRLLLKNISCDDREFVYQEFSDNFVTRYLFDAEPVTDLAGADEIIQFYLTPEPRLQHRWVLHLKQDSQKIGTCGFHCWKRDERMVDIGYDMMEPYTGHGYMNEAVQAIIGFAKTSMDVRVVNACIYFENEQSIKLAVRNGFVLSGNMLEQFRGKQYLHHIYTLRLA